VLGYVLCQRGIKMVLPFSKGELEGICPKL
jgi:hypothetical protein